MRTVAAFFFLIMLANCVGFRLMVSLMEKEHQSAQVAQLDKALYSESDLVVIKTPLQLPYYTNNADWERVDGQVEVGGLVHRYVERRIFNDSLELRLLPDALSTKLQAVGLSLCKTTDLPANDKKTSSLKINFPDWIAMATQCSLFAFQSFSKVYPPIYSVSFSTLSPQVGEKPPQAFAVLFA